MELIGKTIAEVIENYPRYYIRFIDETAIGFTVNESASPNDFFTEDPKDTYEILPMDNEH